MFLCKRHSLPSFIAGRPEAPFPDCRTSHYPAPHRSMCPGAQYQGDPYHRILSIHPDGAIHQRHATIVRRNLHSVRTT